METLNINFVIPHAEKTGGTRVIFTLADQLSKRGHRVNIIAYHYTKWFTFSTNGTVRLIDISRTIGGKIRLIPYYLNLFNQRNLIFRQASLGINVAAYEAMVNQIPNADINISTWCMMSLPVLLKADGSIPVWHMQHLETIFFKNNPKARIFIEMIIRSRINKIVNSTWLEGEVKKITKDKTWKFLPAINHEVFNANNLVKREKEKFKIVTLGKDGWKNGSFVIEAVRKLWKEYRYKRKVELHVYGTDLNWIRNEEFIFKHTNIDDFLLAELYKVSDCTVTASDFESFPLPPLEAMACGSAVITTRFGTEDFAVDMKNAIIIKARDVNSIFDALNKLMTNEELKEKLIMGGLETVKLFTWKKQVELYESILLNLKSSQI